MNREATIPQALDPAMPSDDDLAPLDPGVVDTLTAADVVRSVSLDEALLGRDLKQRMFGKRPAVRIGRYEVLSRIGRGGMGTVYLARDPELDRTVALKVLRDDRKDGHSRMLNEARALARLTHPNIVAVHEVGTHEGRVFLAMEFIEGPTLRAWLEHERSAQEILDVFAQAAAGLNAAHAVGLVHRDFKPENVIIGSDGRVRVVDFGVAKAPSDAAAAGEGARGGGIDLTLTGQLLGTPAYMAAEQFLGSDVDRRADVFALCVALHEAFAGERPFAGDDVLAVSQAVMRNEARTLDSSKVPRSLATLLRRGLSADREQRPTMDALLAELRPGVRRPRMRLQVALAALAAVGVAAGAALYVTTPVEPRLDVRSLAEAQGYARLLDAADDDARVRMGEEFLATFGESSDPARRAVAHASIGRVLWERSCTTPWLGLCLKPEEIEAEPACRPASRGPFTQLARTEAGKAGYDHFVAATQLAGIERPADQALADQWSDAMGESRVRVADHDLEAHLVLRVPKTLDFDTNEALSKTAFELFFSQLKGDGEKLVTAYTAVKGTTPTWEIIAAARSGLLHESMANTFSTHAPPLTMDADKRVAYCDAINDQVIVALREVARGTCQWAAEKAEKSGLVGLPEANGCLPPTPG